MSHTYNLPFTRYGLRGVSDLLSCTAMSAMTTLAYQRMISAGWIKLDGSTSDMPTHQFRQTGFFDGCDAAKYCGDYDAGEQKAYAAAVCYTIKIPADAMSGTVAKVESISATLKGDRWTACGAVLAVIPSTSPNPPSWADVLSATYSSPDPVTAIDDEDPTWQAPLRKLVRSNDGDDTSCDATIPLSSGVDATAYLHVVLRLGDYISAHGAWIEGSAMVVGATLAVTFDRSVTADGQAKIKLLNEYNFDDVGRNDNRLGGVIDSESAIAVKYLQTTGVLPAEETGDAAMMRRLLEMRDAQTVAQLNALGESVAGNVVARHFDVLGGWVGCRYAAIFGPPAYHQYRLHGMLMVRSTYTNCETADGLSLDVAIPTLPVGQIVRVAMYVHSGAMPYAFVAAGDRLALNIVTMASACDPALILGTATSVSLAYFFDSTELPLDTVLPYPAQSVAIVPVGTFDLIGGTGLASGTKIPFSAPVTLPRYCVVIVAINVIGYTSAWVAAPATSTAVQFKPSDLSLHIV